MSKSMFGDDKFDPNLTPILDMVFQLITFFMLVMNFKAASVDLNLRLPVIGSAQPADSRGQGELLVLNLDESGHLRVYGREEKDIEKYIDDEAKSALESARADQPDIKPGDDLPVTVVIRADRAIPFHLLNRVVRECQSKGLRKFHYRAMTKAAEA